MDNTVARMQLSTGKWRHNLSLSVSVRHSSQNDTAVLHLEVQTQSVFRAVIPERQTNSDETDTGFVINFSVYA
eukprot:scaffold25382_cov137-Cylindrotheca_fusiformis.AAC.2